MGIITNSIQLSGTSYTSVIISGITTGTTLLTSIDNLVTEQAIKNYVDTKVTIVNTPLDNQIGVWTSSNALEGTTGLTYSGNTLYVSKSVQPDYIKFNRNPIISGFEAGKMFYDENNKTMSVMIDDDITLQIGQEDLVLVYNNNNFTINNGQLVYFTGSYNDYLTVNLANASTDITSVVVGMATQNIPSGTTGFITTRGLVHDVDTLTYNAGEILYLSDLVNGTFINTLPVNYSSRVNPIGFVVSTGVTGSIYMDINNENIAMTLNNREMNILNGENSSTGLFQFSGVTLSGTTNFNVSSAKGWIVDNTTNPLLPDVKYIEYTGETYLTSPYISSNIATYILLNSGGTLTLQPTLPTPEERRRMIYLAKISHPVFGTFQNVNNNPDVNLSPMSSVRDMFTSMRLINENIIPSSNGTGLTFKVSTGTLWGLGINFVTNKWSPNNIVIPAQIPVTFQYRTQTGSVTGNTTLIDPSVYDVGGVVTPVGGGVKVATNQRIYIFPTNVIRIQYGQTVYSSLSDATANANRETFIKNPNIADNAILIGVLSVLKVATDLSNISEAVFIPASMFGESTIGGLGSSTVTLQNAYDSSIPPQIVTSVTNDGVTLRRGSAADTDNVLVIQNGVGNNTTTIDGSGKVLVTSFQMSGITDSVIITGITSGTTLLTELNNTLVTEQAIKNYVDVSAASLSTAVAKATRLAKAGL